MGRVPAPGYDGFALAQTARALVTISDVRRSAVVRELN